MNVYAWVVLAALLCEWGLSLLSALLDRASADETPPPELADIYDAEHYAESQRYLHAHARLCMLRSSVHLIVLLGFWFGGGFSWLEATTARLSGMLYTGPGAGILHGLLFIGALVLGRALLGLPFRTWATFVIEERFGFNRCTWRTFVADGIRAAILGAVIGIPLIGGVLAFFIYAGDAAWLWCWLAVAAFTLLILYVAPVWIMPLFNRFTPLPAGELRERLLAFAARLGFPLAGVWVIDGSRRSRKGNAFFTGFGRHRRIALYDTLIEDQGPEQLVAILAHEIGHCRLRHLVKQLTLHVVHTGVLCYLLGLFLTEPRLYAAFGLETAEPDALPIHAGLVFFLLLYTPLELLLGPLFNQLARAWEYEADQFAATHQEDGARHLTAALKQLARDNLTNLTPHPLNVFLHYSHPPLRARLAALGGTNAKDDDP